MLDGTKKTKLGDLALVCVFHAHSATDSTVIRPPIPHASGHGFHGHSATLKAGSNAG
jgi:hypothetical protein